VTLYITPVVYTFMESFQNLFRKRRPRPDAAVPEPELAGVSSLRS